MRDPFLRTKGWVSRSLPADNSLVDTVAIEGGVAGEATEVSSGRHIDGVSLGVSNGSRDIDESLLATGDHDTIKIIRLYFYDDEVIVTYERDNPPLYTTVSFPAGQESPTMVGQ